MTRREAREAVFTLLFETDFHPSDGAENIFDVSCDNWEIGDDSYTRDAYFGVNEHLDEIDAVIDEHSHGWKTSRVSGMVRAVLRLGIWEMMYRDDIPFAVSINEAVEIIKKYGEDHAQPFVNGVLNAVGVTLKKKDGNNE